MSSINHCKFIARDKQLLQNGDIIRLVIGGSTFPTCGGARYGRTNGGKCG